MHLRLLKQRRPDSAAPPPPLTPVEQAEAEIAHLESELGKSKEQLRLAINRVSMLQRDVSDRTSALNRSRAQLRLLRIEVGLPVNGKGGGGTDASSITNAKIVPLTATHFNGRRRRFVVRNDGVYPFPFRVHDTVKRSIRMSAPDEANAEAVALALEHETGVLSPSRLKRVVAWFSSLVRRSRQAKGGERDVA